MPPKRHPLVRAFLAGQTFLSPLLDRAPLPREPFVAALVTLRDAHFGRGSLDDALARIHALPLDTLDPELLFLALPAWMQACSLLGRNAEAAALMRRVGSLLSPATPPELRAQVVSQEIFLVGANVRAIEECLRRALQGLPGNSPMHRLIVARLAEHLAFIGREDEVEPQLAAMDGWTRPEHAYFLARIRFFQAVETGRFAEARRLDAEQLAGQAAPYLHPRPLQNYRRILDTLESRPTTSSTPELESTRHLLERRSEAALRVAGLEDAAEDYGFEGYARLRAELANRHVAAAERLLERRRSQGNLSYVDGLFQARLDLLAGRPEAASRRFAETVRACERHDALARLELELRLACELDAGQVFRLSRATGRAGGDAEAPAAVEDRPLQGAARLIGESAAVREVRRLVRRLAPLDAPVLITGETGTGKEVVARALHEESPRAARPFVAVNCAAIGDSLLESELFGHERGAFTGAVQAHAGVFEQAGDGTLLLDEIGDVSPRLQAALLRVLESGEFRRVGGTRTRHIACRIFASTNAPLDRHAGEGRFRPDLLHRLQRLLIDLPPVRQRVEDVVPLVVHFLGEGRRDGELPRLSPELHDLLRRRSWPGNVREIRNFAERLRLLNSETLDYGMESHGIGSTVRNDPAPPPLGTEPATFLSGRSRLRRLDRLRGMFREHGKLARHEIIRALGVSPNTATHDLGILIEEGLVERVEPTASPMTHYFRLRVGEGK